MLSDLDGLMQARGIGTVIVPMHEAQHASFRWMSRGAKVTRGYAIKLHGREPFLLTYPMEREEAAASGLEVALAGEFGYDRILRDAPDPASADAALFDAVLSRSGASGTVAFFGNVPVQLYVDVVEGLEARGWKVHRSRGEDLVQLARKRKDDREIGLIRSVGSRTEEVVEEVRRVLRRWDGREPLKIGDLKELVRREIARRDLLEDHETILSQGRDAAVPHSRGTAADALRPSVPIVLDIFPIDRESGYFFDTTRTFCAGPVPDALRTIHAHVLEAFHLAAEAVRPGTKASRYHEMVCDFFEARGYPTSRSAPGSHDGYVHGLGHGVGLDIHERPSFSLAASNSDLIEEGDIITIEPGLYFPNREIGVRIEDTFVVTARGAESMCRGPYGLEP